MQTLNGTSQYGARKLISRLFIFFIFNSVIRCELFMAVNVSNVTVVVKLSIYREYKIDKLYILHMEFVSIKLV